MKSPCISNFENSGGCMLICEEVEILNTGHTVRWLISAVNTVIIKWILVALILSILVIDFINYCTIT